MPKSVHTPHAPERVIHQHTSSTIVNNLAGGFTQVPNAVLCDQTLPNTAKVIYFYLLHRSQQKDYCWPSIQRIASDLRTSARTVIRMLGILHTHSYVRKARRGLGLTNLYHISLLPSHEVPHGTDEDEPAFFDASEKCQFHTPASAKLAAPEVPECHTERYISKYTQREVDSKKKISSIARHAGSAAAEEPSFEKELSFQRAEPEAIGIKKCNQCKKEQGAQEPDRTNLSDNASASQGCKGPVESVKITDQQTTPPEETSRPERAKDVENDKNATEGDKYKKGDTEDKGKTERSVWTFEGMATLVGITPEALQDLKTWMQTHRRPAIIPVKLQGLISKWSREMDNAEPHLIAANLTQASKLYAYARLHGLSQPATEDCFAHAWAIVHSRRTIRKKMAFLFSSLKLDILIALKEATDLGVGSSSILSSIPDGYDEELPVADIPPTTVDAWTSPPVWHTPTPAPEPETLSSIPDGYDEELPVADIPPTTVDAWTSPPVRHTPTLILELAWPASEPATPAVKPPTLPSKSPASGWKSWETANWWGERLRDELDPARTFSRYDVYQIEDNRYGFELSLSAHADSVWDPLAGCYVTSIMVREVLKTIQAWRAAGAAPDVPTRLDQSDPPSQRTHNVPRRQMRSASSRYTDNPYSHRPSQYPGTADRQGSLSNGDVSHNQEIYLSPGLAEHPPLRTGRAGAMQGQGSPLAPLLREQVSALSAIRQRTGLQSYQRADTSTEAEQP